MNVKKSIIYLLFVLFIISCGQSRYKKQTTTGKWLKVERPTYSVEYPDDWEFVEDGRLESTFIIYSPYESSKDKFRENILLKISDLLEPDMDLKRILELSENPDNRTISDFKILKSEIIESSPYKYYEIIFSGKQRGHEYKRKQYAWIINNKIILLIFNSKLEKYDQFIDTADSIMNSFKLTLNNEGG